MTQTKEKNSVIHKILTGIGIVLCVLLVPILVINCTLLVKGFVNKGQVPTFGDYAPLIVLTNSMSGEGEDSFDGGDLIFIRTAEAKDVQVGDVISFFDPRGNGSSVVTHRVVEILEEDGLICFRTKGDANPSEDLALVTADKLVGIYTGVHIAGAGQAAMFMQTTTGLIVCVVLPTLLLVGYDIIRRRGYDKQHIQDKQALLAELEELRKLKAEKELESKSEE